MPPLPRFLRTLAAVAVLPSALLAGEPPIIAKARAYLGNEAALAQVRSVRFTGTLTTSDPTDPGRQTSARIEITSQRPDQHRIVIRSDQAVETTGLDGYDGWTRTDPLAEPGRWRLTLLTAPQIKRLRANAWETVAYYRGLEQRGGQVEDLGTTTREGITCQKVAFVHGPGIVFHRFFDTATGRLVLTETESGGTIREQGEMIVDGVRFPRAIVTETPAASGPAQAVTITFETVALNVVFPPDLFAVPQPGRP